MKEKTFVYILLAVAIIVGAYIYVAPSITQTNISSSSVSSVPYVTTIVLDKTAYIPGDTIKVYITSIPPVTTAKIPIVLKFKITVSIVPNINTIITATQTAYAATQTAFSGAYIGSYSFKIPTGATYPISITVIPTLSDGSSGKTVSKVLTLKATWS